MKICRACKTDNSIFVTKCSNCYQADFDYAINAVMPKDYVPTAYDCSTANKTTECVHDWQLYKGFNHDDMYCLKCNKVRPLTEHELNKQK